MSLKKVLRIYKKVSSNIKSVKFIFFVYKSSANRSRDVIINITKESLWNKI